VAGLVVCAALVAGYLVLVHDSDREYTPPAGARHAADARTRAALATDTLDRLSRLLTRGSASQLRAFTADDAPRSRRLVDALFHNVRALRMRDLDLRYVDEDTAAVARSARRWSADVEVSWRLAGVDARVNDLEVRFTFARHGDRAVLVDTAGADDGVPLWLLTRLAVERHPRSLVMAADPADADTYAALAEEAVTDVAQVLPDWDGSLVVEVPGSQKQLDELLGASPEAYQGIAAITSTVDGSSDPQAATHIFVNPDVFADLGTAGAQIVLSHEATHVATGAATSAMEMWLLEGFADYVALAHVNLPVSVTASQILADVRRDGPPEHLPTAAEFDPSNSALGAEYEAAWLACRLLAQTYGEQQLIRLYDVVDAGTPLPRALREVLGTDQETFTAQWRDYLRRLAGETG
jgi:hypothetical protein